MDWNEGKRQWSWERKKKERKGYVTQKVHHELQIGRGRDVFGHDVKIGSVVIQQELSKQLFELLENEKKEKKKRRKWSTLRDCLRVT